MRAQTTLGNIAPLAFRPRYVEKVWGGQALERIVGKLPRSREPIGEAWLVWDGLLVKGGAYHGQTLANVLRGCAPSLLGQSLEDIPGQAFPLLVKFLDAAENLSVQVHPDDEYARAREAQPFGKCEMWYVLAADPNAVVYHGVRRDLGVEELRAALREGTLVSELERVTVKPGDVLINHPGTVHALGGGVVLYELQQSCDLTYRLYDWDRGGRELHLDKGLDVIDRRPHLSHLVEPIDLDESDHRRAILGVSRYFAAELLTVPDRASVAGEPNRWEILTAIEGSGRIRTSPGGRWRVLRSGETLLIPVGHQGFLADATTGPLRLIRAYVPDLPRDVVAPLLGRGIEPARIAALGGDPIRSDLRGLLDR